MRKKDIKNLTLNALKEALIEINEPPYRAGQIFSWLYRVGVHSFDEMGNIPQTLKTALGRSYYIGKLKLYKHLKSIDGTEKFVFELTDNRFIETVLIHAKHRNTVCLSTQVGCKFACAFCSSGRGGFDRDLTPSEITGQILYLERELKHKVTNYVFMGMGEPLDNYENVAKAIAIMNDPKGMGIGSRRITISTCGIIPGIEKLKNLGLQVNLSLSLHATGDRKRSALMPVNRKYPLEALIKACEGYIEKTGRMITLEYVLMKGVNDSAQDADGLISIARRLRAKVNLILCSAISGSSLWPPERKKVNMFKQRLIGKKVKATLRESKGKDVLAACGQLAGRRK
ncbi:MAG: 23S rRNA (adenine(2503)-C(2))-methyltransferase RlmN [Omnitrophica bacterium]|nr:23S rRNA (adenine(2503)-C(2))-methyltransferase RlmN [Candidatus Omnitrophota bacterium]